MIILDLFCGTKSIANTFEDRGHKVYTVDWDDKFNPSLVADIGTLTANDIIDLCGGVPDVIWASPDCFVKGTLVNTYDGYKNIENVQIELPEKCYTQIKQIANQYGMDVLEPTDEFESGVIVKCGNIEYNYNFEENMLFLDEEIEKEIDAIIFS